MNPRVNRKALVCFLSFNANRMLTSSDPHGHFRSKFQFKLDQRASPLFCQSRVTITTLVPILSPFPEAILICLSNNGGPFERKPASKQIGNDRVEIPTDCRLEPETKGRL